MINTNCITKQDLLNKNIDGKQGIWLMPTKEEPKFKNVHHVGEKGWWVHAALKGTMSEEKMQKYLEGKVVDPITDADNHMFKFINEHCEFDENGELISAWGIETDQMGIWWYEPELPLIDSSEDEDDEDEDDYWDESWDDEEDDEITIQCWEYVDGTLTKYLTRFDPEDGRYYTFFIDKTDNYYLLTLLCYEDEDHCVKCDYEDRLSFYLPKSGTEEKFSEKILNSLETDFLIDRLNLKVLELFYMSLRLALAFYVSFSYEGEMPLESLADFMRFNGKLKSNKYEKDKRYQDVQAWEKYHRGFVDSEGNQI